MLRVVDHFDQNPPDDPKYPSDNNNNNSNNTIKNAPVDPTESLEEPHKTLNSKHEDKELVTTPNTNPNTDLNNLNLQTDTHIINQDTRNLQTAQNQLILMLSLIHI